MLFIVWWYVRIDFFFLIITAKANIVSSEYIQEYFCFFCQLGTKEFPMTNGKVIIATWSTVETGVTPRSNGRRESGVQERCGKAERVFLARRYTMTSGIPDTTVPSLTGNPAIHGSGIIRIYICDRIIETNARRTWTSGSPRNIGKRSADSVVLYKIEKKSDQKATWSYISNFERKIKQLPPHKHSEKLMLKIETTIRQVVIPNWEYCLNQTFWKKKKRKENTFYWFYNNEILKNRL